MEKVRVRPDITAMEGYHFISGPYEVLTKRLGRPVDQIIKLDTNENLYGPSPKALAALAALGQDVAIYPDLRLDQLRALLAEYVEIDAEHLMVGAGADHMIDLTLRLFLEPNDAIINCPPTFTMYSLTARWIGNCRVVDVPRHADFSLDIEGIEAAARKSGAKLLFLCEPNNPDGGLMPPGTLERLLELPLTVVVDEAYVEFSEHPGFAELVPTTPNLILLRTFSKWAGLAGLRIGYGIYPLDIIEHLWKIKSPFNVSLAADVAARATLQDMEYMQTNIQKIIVERERMRRELAQLPYLEPLPSQGSFVLCKVNGMTGTALKQQLDEYGILIRNYSKPGLQEFVRVSVGKPEHTDALLTALREIGANHD